MEGQQCGVLSEASQTINEEMRAGIQVLDERFCTRLLSKEIQRKIHSVSFIQNSP